MSVGGSRWYWHARRNLARAATRSATSPLVSHPSSDSIPSVDGN